MQAIPTTPETARKEVAMDPLGPLGVELTVGLLVLGFEDTDNLAVHVSTKVRSRGPLGDSQGLDARVNGLLDGIHNRHKPSTVHGLRMVWCQCRC